MRTAAVIGAGLGGLAAALFMARRGLEVVLIEKDEGEPPAESDSTFQDWRRRGVAQMRQPHVVLGRGTAILEREAPDVLAALEARGALRITSQGEPACIGGAPTHVCARRPLFEAVLRAAALKEDGVELLAGVEAVGLLSRPGVRAPRVTGVRLSDGRAVEADLVIDAAGRWASSARWLAAIGAEVTAEYCQALEFHYVTRWYRRRPGAALPSLSPISRASAGFAALSAFRADGDSFALSVLVSLRDPRRGRLRDPEAFERVLAESRLLAPWAEAGAPITETLVLSRIENRSVSLIGEAGPVAAGLLLVGDAAVHMNPTLGLGASLALSMAERAAELASQAPEAGEEFVAGFEAWRGREIDPWFRLQAEVDGTTLKEMRLRLANHPASLPEGPRERFFRAAELEANENPSVFQALDAMRHMLLSPERFAADPEVRAAVRRRLRRRRPFEAAAPDLAREAFEAALTSPEAVSPEPALAV